MPAITWKGPKLKLSENACHHPKRAQAHCLKLPENACHHLKRAQANCLKFAENGLKRAQLVTLTKAGFCTPKRACKTEPWQEGGEGLGVEKVFFFEKKRVLCKNLPWRLLGPPPGMSVTRSVINYGKSVTRSVINYGKSVTMSVIWRFSGLQIPTLIVWELITVTDADTDTDFNVFELDM